MVSVHVLVGVGWFGITAAKLILEVVSAGAIDPQMARAGYLFMAAFDRAVFPPLAIATLATGIVLSLGTAWGLFRYWWVVVKLALTLGVVVTGVAFVGAWTEEAMALASGVADTTTNVKIRLIVAAVTHLLMLGAATIISVFKPWGRIRPVRLNEGV